MADKGAQGFAVGLAGDIYNDVLEVLAQGAEQHVQLGGAGVFQRFIAHGVSEDAQAFGATGEGAVDQRGVQPPQMAQGIAEMKRAFQAEQRQAVTARQTQVQQQGMLTALLHHLRHVCGQQCAVGTALYAIQHGQAAQVRIRRDGGQAFAQAPHQSRDFTGA
ncbi:hypothetical protein D3C81_1589990 [compost metagenome]